MSKLREIAASLKKLLPFINVKIKQAYCTNFSYMYISKTFTKAL